MSTFCLWARSEIDFVLRRLGTSVGNAMEWEKGSGK